MTEVRASAAVSHLPPQKAAVSLAAAMVVQVAAVPDLPQRHEIQARKTKNDRDRSTARGVARPASQPLLNRQSILGYECRVSA